MNVTPRTGGGDRQKSPKTGGGDHNKSPKSPGGKSAPSDAPAVRSFGNIRPSGDPHKHDVKSTIVNEPPQPSKPSVDRSN